MTIVFREQMVGENLRLMLFEDILELKRHDRVRSVELRFDLIRVVPRVISSLGGRFFYTNF